MALVPEAKPSQLLRVDDVARRLHLSRATVYRKIAEGTIPAVRLGNGHAALRIPEDQLEAWLWRDWRQSDDALARGAARVRSGS